MAESARQYEVISVSLPKSLVERINRIVPRARRSGVIRALLASFLDAVDRRRVAEEYAAYYAHRAAGEAEEERKLLAEWDISDAEAWAILEREESRGRRATR